MTQAPSSSPTTGGPVRPTRRAHVRWRPVAPGAARVSGGFWSDRQRANGERAVPGGLARLEEAGNLGNLRAAAARLAGGPAGEATGPIFMDSDVYKWLEAVAWEYARTGDADLLAAQRRVTEEIAAAQEPDGYLDSVVQVREGARYRDLSWSHEHYCAGHLFQAAVAQVRCTGDRGLLDVAVRLADHLVREFGPDRRHDVDGHPVVEMALVELYRETGDQAYLDLATYFVQARGHGLMASYGREPTYFSDRVPVAEASTVEGHAVRAVYLAAGAADVAAETGDDVLLGALRRQFDHMLETKTYVTGGLGSRWEGEAFGDEHELPTDRGYAETCAAIGGVQWAWRLLLATGDPRYADAMERMLLNGFLAGVSLGGDEYFYVNPLQLRTGAHADENRSPAHGRRGWFDCACCPPNIMRMLASLDGHLATSDDAGLQLHLFATGSVRADLAAGPAAVDVVTDYPWDGVVTVTVTETGSGPWALALRVPAWAEGATLVVDGTEAAARPGTYATTERVWSVGDVVELRLPMPVRLSVAHPRVDAARGCVALERGPLVFAVEQADQPDGVVVEDLRVAPGVVSRPDEATTTRWAADLLGGVVTIGLPAIEVTPGAAPDGRPVDVVAVPYSTWANRGPGAMRVWLPTT